MQPSSRFFRESNAFDFLLVTDIFPENFVKLDDVIFLSRLGVNVGIWYAMVYFTKILLGLTFDHFCKWMRLVARNWIIFFGFAIFTHDEVPTYKALIEKAFNWFGMAAITPPHKIHS